MAELPPKRKPSPKSQFSESWALTDVSPYECSQFVKSPAVLLSRVAARLRSETLLLQGLWNADSSFLFSLSKTPMPRSKPLGKLSKKEISRVQFSRMLFLMHSGFQAHTLTTAMAAGDFFQNSTKIPWIFWWRIVRCAVFSFWNSIILFGSRENGQSGFYSIDPYKQKTICVASRIPCF